MAKLTIEKYRPDYGSHNPILIKVMELSEGPVLELGMGAFSTPLLHYLCQDQGRQLVSYENFKSWFDSHRDFRNNDHEINFVADWADLAIESTHWGVVLIDHTGDRRAIDAIRLANSADYVVIHDSNDRNENHYHYSTVYPYYKYKYIYDKISPHTTVLSNFKDLSNL